MQKLLLVYYYSENRATSRIWKVLPNMVFPRFGGKNWGRYEQAHVSYRGLRGLSFPPPGFSPNRGGVKGEFRDLTRSSAVVSLHFSCPNLASVFSSCYSWHLLTWSCLQLEFSDNDRFKMAQNSFQHIPRPRFWCYAKNGRLILTAKRGKEIKLQWN